MHIVFHGGGHGAVHHFQTCGNNACGNHGRHRLTGFANVVKAGHDATRQLGLGNEFDRHLGGDGQHAFRADHQAEQVKTWRVQRVRAKLNALAGDGEAGHLDDVVQRQAVFQAMHAA